MEFKEITAKTVDEAITKACLEFETSSDNLEIQVVQEGTSGFLGFIGSKPAVIKVRKKVQEEEFDILKELAKEEKKEKKTPVKEEKKEEVKKADKSTEIMEYDESGNEVKTSASSKDKKDSKNTAETVIIVIVVVVIIAAAGVGGFYFYKKRKVQNGEK